MTIRRNPSITSILIYSVLCLFVLFCAFPIFYLGLTSLKPYKALYTSPPQLFLFEPTLENFKVMWEQAGYHSFLNSLIVSIGATVISLFFGVLAAYGFTMFNFSGRKFWMFLVLVTRAYPPVTTLIPVYFIIQYLGLIDTKIGLIIALVGLQTSLVIWVMRSFFATIPKEIMESVMVDGGSLWTAFFRIALPLSMPGLVASGVLIFVLYWNEFLMPLILTSSNVSRTVPVAISTFLVSEEKAHWGTLSGLGLLGTIPALIILWIGGKYLVKGLTAGAVKG
jgi:multiple sugar transport system permease protein